MSTELERKDRVIASLKKALVDKTDKTNRRDKIANIINSVKAYKQEQKQSIIDSYANSNLSVEEISQIYEGIYHQAIQRYNSNSIYK